MNYIKYKMQLLGDLFNKYGSDKDRNGYTVLYQSLFKNLRQQPVDLLEIGIGTMLPDVYYSMHKYALPGYKPGGSLRAWRDYFPNGNIIGCDIQPDTQFSEDRIVTYLADSTKKEELDNVLGDKMFDIILDDGDHWEINQLKTLKNLWHRLKPNGYYIIEDLQEWNRIGTEFKPEIREFIGEGPDMYLTEKRNIFVISK